MSNPAVDSEVVINKVSLFSRREEPSRFFYFNKDSLGGITFTRFDTVNLVVSGRFHFELNGNDYDRFVAESGNFTMSTINVTEGRFDLKIKHYYP